MKASYPLHRVQEVRQRTADARAAAVRDRAQRTAQAQAAHQTAAAERAREERTSDEIRSQERARLLGGQCRAADLARAAEWERGAQERLGALARVEQATHTQLCEDRHEEDLARALWARAQAERDAVRQHRERWLAAREAEREARAEEGAAEIWGNRRFGAAERPFPGKPTDS